MPLKLFWILFGTSLCSAAGIIPVLVGGEPAAKLHPRLGSWSSEVVLPTTVWCVSYAALVVVGIGALLSIPTIVHSADVFELVEFKYLHRIIGMIRSAVFVYMLWTICLLMFPHSWPWLALSMAGIMVATYWLAVWKEYRLVRQPKNRTPPRSVPTDRGGQSEKIGDAREVLKIAGYGQVRILSYEEVKDDTDKVGGHQIKIQIPPSGGK